MLALLNDAQTSGGLIIAVDADKAGILLDELHGAGVAPAAVFGEVLNGPPGSIELEP